MGIHPSMSFPPPQYDEPAILPPLDNGELMAAAAAYVFWPVYSPVLLMRAQREQLYLRFHALQSILFGLLATVGFVVFTVVLSYFYQGVGAPESLWLGFVLMSFYVGWLVGLLFAFCLFLVFAWRAGRGDVFRVPLIGGLVERWVLRSVSEE